MVCRLIVVLSALSLLLAGCSSDPATTTVDAAPDKGVDLSPDVASDQQPDQPIKTDAIVDLPAPDLAPDLASDVPMPDITPDANPWASVSCSTEPPPGAKLADPPPAFSGGSCPTLVAGENYIESTSNGQTHNRRFLLLLPSNLQPDEKLPVLFMWYWLKGSPEEFRDKGEIQQAVDDQRFVAVIPEGRGGLDFFGLIDLPWPMTTLDTDERMQEEFVFFDDMHSCISAQYNVNKECVSSVGVSAGALFTVQLAQARSQFLSSFISLSGGIGGGGTTNAFIRGWTAPPKKLPALVLWGGPADSCVLLNFELASKTLETELFAGGHFFVECIHNCKHGEPPLEPPPGISRYSPIWEFAFTHPFWLPDGASPYYGNPQPVSFLDWCGIGSGSATIRQGDCPPPGCPI